MGLRLADIRTERQWKIESLLADRLEREKGLFLASLAGLSLPREERDRVLEALEFSLAASPAGGGDLIYGAHPVRVARFAAEWLAPWKSSRPGEVLAACLIHNAIEKKLLAPETVRARHGAWVADSLATLTVDREEMATAPGRQAYYDRLSGKDAEVRAIKLFDKFDNIFSLCLNPDEKVRRGYLDEIVAYVRPIAEEVAPSLVPYLDDLLDDARAIGYFRPAVR